MINSLQNLEALNDNITFRIKKNPEGLYSYIFDCLFNNVVILQIPHIKSQFIENRRQPLLINFTNLTISLSENIIKSYQNPEQKNDPLIKNLIERTGLDVEEQKNEIKKIIALASSHLLSFTVMVEKEEDIFPWTQPLHNLYIDYFKEGCIVKEIRFNDFPIETLNCAAFALIYLKDNDFIKNFKEKDHAICHPLFTGQHEIFFSALHYSPSKSPKPNDLVVYLTKVNDLEEVKHLGIYQENGTVLSKKGGVAIPFIYEHKLDQVPFNYGNFIRFYKKISPLECPPGTPN